MTLGDQSSGSSRVLIILMVIAFSGGRGGMASMKSMQGMNGRGDVFDSLISHRDLF